MRLTRWLRRGLLPVIATLLCLDPATATDRTAPPFAGRGEAGPQPAIWLLADGDTRIFLFGTVHILPPRLQWRSADLNRIVAEADELVLEIGEDPAQMDPVAILRPMNMGKSVPILSRVSPDRREALREMIATSGLPIEAYDQMHSWAASMMLAAAAFRAAYADPGMPEAQLTGVEDALRAEFERTERPISGVETSEQQLGFFNRMSLRTQREMLEAMVDAHRQGEAAFEPLESGWVSGNVEGIAGEMAEMPPEMFDLLITRRNANWTDWLIARLNEPGDVLFAVGAGHLAGRDSVQTMLQARGLAVRRLH